MVVEVQNDFGTDGGISDRVGVPLAVDHRSRHSDRRRQCGSAALIRRMRDVDHV
jgi:hypothetical protein